MQKLSTKQIIIGILGLIAVVFGYFNKGEVIDNQEIKDAKSQEIVDFDTNTDSENDKSIPRQVTDDTESGNQRLTYEGKELILTHHAKCRMDCREISKAEVREVIKEGKENKRKSNPNDSRCPTIALEDWTEDGQRVRIIVADCDNVAKLVTVIDLENEYKCDCR